MLTDVVVFGASGDLTARLLLPAMAELEAASLLDGDLRIRGQIGRTGPTTGSGGTPVRRWTPTPVTSPTTRGKAFSGACPTARST